MSKWRKLLDMIYFVLGHSLSSFALTGFSVSGGPMRGREGSFFDGSFQLIDRVLFSLGIMLLSYGLVTIHWRRYESATQIWQKEIGCDPDSLPVAEVTEKRKRSDDATDYTAL
jgi:hypothetical protein